jgi:hypothetical protein
MSTQATPTVSDPIPVDQTYYVVVGNITAGTPPQQFTVSIDLWEEDLYLIGVGADGTSGESNASKNQYDKSASTTYQNPNVSFSADSGGVSGMLANDLVNLGDLNVNLTFGDADSVDWWVNFLPIDGVLGLSPQDSSNNIPNVQNQLASQMADPVMVIHMNNDTHDSFISFGSEDVPQCQQPWAHVPNGILDGYGLSNMNVTSLSIEGTTTSLAMSNRPLVVSNWLDTKFVSNQTRDLLIQASGATRNNQTRQYELPCASMAQAKNVVMTLSVGVTITLTPNDYMLVRVDPNDGTSTCTLDVVGWYDENEPNYRSYELELDQRFLKTRCVSYNSQTKVLGLTPLASSVQLQPNTGPTPEPMEASTQS